MSRVYIPAVYEYIMLCFHSLQAITEQFSKKGYALRTNDLSIEPLHLKGLSGYILAEVKNRAELEQIGWQVRLNNPAPNGVKVLYLHIQYHWSIAVGNYND